MKRKLRGWVAWVFVALIGSLPINANAESKITLEELHQQMEEMRRNYEQQIGVLQAQINDLSKGGSGVVSDGESRFAKEESRQFLGTIRDEFKNRIVGRTILGGYADMEFIDRKGGGESFFDQHRIVPFIYADVTDQIKMASEIEFEHGGPQNNQDDGEVKVEFAVIDYELLEALNFRAGILLSPLGHFNLIHDSPINDLTARPLVATNIIPTTLSEAGAGFYGSFYPTELSKVDYEVYLVNGFEGFKDFDPATGDADVAITQTAGVRGARGSQSSDINDNKAVVGRIAMSPFLGTEVGVSAHIGDYDEEGDNTLAIYAVDWTLQKGPFELIGEYAVANIEREGRVALFNESRLKESERIPGRIDGAYLQLNYHWMADWLREACPLVFKPESVFTLVGRYDVIDLGNSDSGIGERDRWTVGGNFRPTEDTAFKLEYQINDGDRSSDKDNAFLASVATYF